MDGNHGQRLGAAPRQGGGRGGVPNRPQNHGNRPRGQGNRGRGNQRINPAQYGINDDLDDAQHAGFNPRAYNGNQGNNVRWRANAGAQGPAGDGHQRRHRNNYGNEDGNDRNRNFRANAGGARGDNAPEFQGQQQQPGFDRGDNHGDGNGRRYNGPNDGNRKNNNRNPRFMGFRGLEELSNFEAKDIILKINEKKEAFTNLLNSPIEGRDLFVLLMKLIAKVCQSSFDELKLKLLLDICNSRFLNNFLTYMMQLPYVERKAANNMYWNNQLEFWENFIIFCESIINLSPSTALLTCRSLIEGSSKCCLELLQQRHGFALPEQLDLKLSTLRERLTHCEKEEKENQRKKRSHYAEDLASSEPPDDFRKLSVIPTRDDLRQHMPFVRPNIVAGSYRDVDHYLDVQFRLLREDCIGPLRDGIAQFIENPNKKKLDNIRVYRNVKFVENYIKDTKIGLFVQLDEKNTRNFKRINWAHSKRFIYGSLLLFTSDNCKTFIVATILDREPKRLEKGLIPVSIMDNTRQCENMCNDVSYIMIESEVYFEPYFHVLKALQDPSFPQHLAMSKYIVNVDPTPQPPAYLQYDTRYSVETKYSPNIKFVVMNNSTWPTKEDLGLNKSQYEAYHLALTHEFAVIQGPPGTGKTFLGVQVAKTLLQNIEAPSGVCLMLVICYTNHALDQFLEAILPITDSIVRIGGQSRNEAMEKLNLASLRKKTRPDRETSRLFYEQRDTLKQAISGLRHAQERVDNLNNGIMSYDCMKALVPESEFLGRFYGNHENYNDDPLKHWLLEGRVRHHRDFNVEAVAEENPEEMHPNDADEDDYLRNDPIVDDIDDEEDLNVDVLSDMTIKISFSVEDARKKLAAQVSLYRKTNDPQRQYEIHNRIVDLKSRIDLFEEMEAYRNRNCDIAINHRTNFARLSTEQRWSIYFKWANLVLHRIKERMRPLQTEVQSTTNAYEEARMLIDMQILRGIKVVGMTTSGAARLRKLLMALEPRIVIVEEAAEVLEQHIVTSLTRHCQHLILIGDHQQLRPSAAHMKLARHFNLEISLFERMITNGIHSRRLGVQHRMRPEIARLICPHIYPQLENHPSVENFPNVRGMTDNLFFFTHEFKEQQVEDSASKSNHLEADMTLKLANYIMQQGYQPEDVTILGAYSGQMFYMRKQRDQYRFLSKVKITVVDNYQGEESKIILLSLVRNNDQNKIGFLGTENRVCVALSRAREGFYIIGNIDILKRNSELWERIADTLESEASLGSALMLRCENHSNQITMIQSPDDFSKVPEGGCLLKCNFNLPCGHRCPMVCHGYDRSHVTTKCLLPCERILCELNHVCPQLCWMDCEPCVKPVPKLLPCGHTKTVLCHIDPADPTVKCGTMVKVKLPNCGHEVPKPCHQKIESVRCPVPCKYRVDKCGHNCRRACHVNDDPDHETYLCEKPCARSKKGCSLSDTLTGDRGDHQCPKKCYETCDDCNVKVTKKRSNCTHREKVACNMNVDEKPCMKNCAKTLECGHFCKKKCFEPCGDCKQKVKKVIPDCNHEVEVMCKDPATRNLCTKKCERTLSCGHPCTGYCKAECDASKCKKLAPQKYNAPCGHVVQLPCNVYRQGVFGPEVLLQHCTEPCNSMLSCEHYCGGTCSQCHQRRLHVACQQPCDRPNVCGHLCKQPCNQICPPCNMPCEIKCKHASCSRLCGAPCVPCQEPCTRVCPHGACTSRCGEPCSRGPCDEPCVKALRCGHRCRGLCGEPCPDICNECRPEEFPVDVISLGDPYDDDAKFVKLEDCTHVESVENMDNLMLSDQQSIEIRSCHMCRTPIINTHRYKDLINDMYRNGINAVKEKVYGNARQIEHKRKEVANFIMEISGMVHDGHVIEANENWLNAFQRIKVEFASRKHSLPQLEIQYQYLNILLMIAQNYKEYAELNTTVLKSEMMSLIRLMCDVLMKNINTISQQLQRDIGNELKRMSGIIQLAKTISHPTYLSMRTATKVRETAEKALDKVTTWKVYDHTEASAAMKELQDALQVIITKEERDLIVRAIGSKAGSWYKCPNGHIYSIDACGGAMQVGRCADCGEAIGGTSHTLLPTNRHAGEVDGSGHSAWPGAGMNMANYQL